MMSKFAVRNILALLAVGQSAVAAPAPAVVIPSKAVSAVSTESGLKKGDLDLSFLLSRTVPTSLQRIDKRLGWMEKRTDLPSPTKNAALRTKVQALRALELKSFEDLALLDFRAFLKMPAEADKELATIKKTVVEMHEAIAGRMNAKLAEIRKMALLFASHASYAVLLHTQTTLMLSAPEKQSVQNFHVDLKQWQNWLRLVSERGFDRAWAEGGQSLGSKEAVEAGYRSAVRILNHVMMAHALWEVESTVALQFFRNDKKIVEEKQYENELIQDESRKAALRLMDEQIKELSRKVSRAVLQARQKAGAEVLGRLRASREELGRQIQAKAPAQNQLAPATAVKPVLPTAVQPKTEPLKI